ncbi:hypothetical protein ACFXKJ_41760, partial [Kitasatospora indigofera]
TGPDAETGSGRPGRLAVLSIDLRPAPRDTGTGTTPTLRVPAPEHTTAGHTVGPVGAGSAKTVLSSPRHGDKLLRRRVKDGQVGYEVPVKVLRPVHLSDALRFGPTDARLPRGAVLLRQQIEGGRVRYWLPEEMLHPDDTSAGAADRTGLTKVHSGPRNPWDQDAERVALAPDDMPLPPITPPELAVVLREALHVSGGLSHERVESLMDTVLQQRRITGLFQQGLPSGVASTETLHFPGTLVDQHVVVRITGTLTKSPTTVSGPVRVGRLVLDEITPRVTVTRTAGSAHALTVTGGYGFRRAEDVTHLAWLAAGFSWNSSHSRGQEIVARSTTGGIRLDAVTEYQRHYADVTFTVEVETWADGPLGHGRAVREVRHVLVQDGLPYLH